MWSIGSPWSGGSSSCWYPPRSTARVPGGVPCPQNEPPFPSSIPVGERYSVPRPLRCYAGGWKTKQGTSFRRLQASDYSSKQSSSHSLDHAGHPRCQVAWIYRDYLRRAPFLLLGSTSETGDQTCFQGLPFLPSLPLPSSATVDGCSSIRETCSPQAPIPLGRYWLLWPSLRHHGAVNSQEMDLLITCLTNRAIHLEVFVFGHRFIFVLIRPIHLRSRYQPPYQSWFSATMAQFSSPARKSYVIGSSPGTWIASIPSSQIKVSSGIFPLHKDHTSVVCGSGSSNHANELCSWNCERELLTTRSWLRRSNRSKSSWTVARWHTSVSILTIRFRSPRSTFWPMDLNPLSRTSSRESFPLEIGGRWFSRSLPPSGKGGWRSTSRISSSVASGFRIRRNLRVGDVVIVIEPCTPVGQFPLARVTEVLPADDGVVRIVRVKMSSSEKIRLVANLCLLEESCDGWFFSSLYVFLSQNSPPPYLKNCSRPSFL